MSKQCDNTDFVEWHYDTEGQLTEMVLTSREVSRVAFLKHVYKDCLEQLEAFLGYGSDANGTAMADDHNVRYFRSRLNEKIVYYVACSGTEYVFV